VYQLPGKHIAFAFSDAAGANACVAMAKICKAETKISSLLFSNKKYPGCMDTVTIVEDAPDFRNLGVDCVFTGTSHPESSGYFELNAIRKAVRENIYTISFIDHWVNFKLRFDGLDGSQYPDEIWVVDEKARQLGIEEGLPAEKLFIRENPYHYYLKNYWRSQYTDKAYLDQLQIPKSGFHILFAPDPLSIRNGRKIAGFDEVDALNDLLSILPELDSEIYLIVKCHPLQPVNVLQEVIGKNKTSNCFLTKEADPLELINTADLVVGFYSNLLLEAEVLGKEIIRYFPGNPEADLLKHKKNLEPVQNKNELLAEIKRLLQIEKSI
jgi:hypothetical protein